MLNLTHHSRIFIYQEPISMHKSFEGLSAAVEHHFPGQLFSGALFLFLNRQRNHIKLLFWDQDGLAIWYKRLEKGTFAKTIPHSLDRREFLMLLEGIEPKKVRSKIF